MSKDSELNSEEQYTIEIKKTLYASQLNEGESYYYLTKTQGYVFLGKLIKFNSEVKKICWHDGPTFEHQLFFENKQYQPLILFSDTIRGFLHASNSGEAPLSFPNKMPL